MLTQAAKVVKLTSLHRASHAMKTDAQLSEDTSPALCADLANPTLPLNLCLSVTMLSMDLAVDTFLLSLSHTFLMWVHNH